MHKIGTIWYNIIFVELLVEILVIVTFIFKKNLNFYTVDAPKLYVVSILSICISDIYQVISKLQLFYYFFTTFVNLSSYLKNQIQDLSI